MRLIVAGAGGHASVVIDVARLAFPSCDVVGLLDDRIPAGTVVEGSRVLGSIAHVADIPHDAVALAIGDNAARADVYRRMRDAGEQLPQLVHPSAVIASTAKLGSGTVVLANAVVNAGVVIEDDVIVNTAATIDHHSHIGTHTHVAPGVHLAGACRIGEGSLLGIGVVVAPGVSIGSWTVVGAGSVVLKDLPDDVVAYGSPASVIRGRPAFDDGH